MRRSYRSLAFQQSDEQRNDDTENDASSDREIEGEIVTPNINIAGQPAKTTNQWYGATTPNQQSDSGNKQANYEQCFA
jgi:hypothetical protein